MLFFGHIVISISTKTAGVVSDKNLNTYIFYYFQNLTIDSIDIEDSYFF